MIASLALIAALGACGGGGDNKDSAAGAIATANLDSRTGTEYEETGTGPMVAPTVPSTPSVPTYMGKLECKDGGQPPPLDKPLPEGSSCTRVFHLTAMQFTQMIAHYPVKTAKVWGYAGEGQDPSTPGPTLVSFAGERVQIELTDKLLEPTTIHPHGLHQPNAADGVAVISQKSPVMPGKTYSYPAFVPGHVGSFAYHAHFDSAVQEQRGLNGMWDVLPRQEHESVKADVDVNMTLQIWAWPKNGALVKPFGFKGMFPIDTINGKTGDNSGGPIDIKKGDHVRIRLYNASQQTHAMHLHGQDIIAESKNGHAIPAERETTQTVNPGDFYEIEFQANNPGNWIFHCHFPHHTANGHTSGYNGAPTGMTRIFHYDSAPPIDPRYFSSLHFASKTVKPGAELAVPDKIVKKANKPPKVPKFP